MGVAQHHDAVSGTAKQVVTYNYAKRLADGVAACMEVVNHAFQKILTPTGATYKLPDQEFCPLVNISVCNVTERSSSVRSSCLMPTGINSSTNSFSFIIYFDSFGL